ncbi:hypothetical protein Taro_003942 [Colocasia esculenta]|uniref:Uncharacterized protein n=1 Tax=Colocasia esculenta TaxID=4460 RepID=A0A843TQ74_COLES|nr:hypothetical protein [Colocasia esculenta]
MDDVATALPIGQRKRRKTAVLLPRSGMSLELAGVVWKSSWWLRSCGTTTRSSSSSPLRLLQLAQTTILKSTKGHGVCPRALV